MAITAEQTIERASQLDRERRALRQFIDEMMRKSRSLIKAMIVNEDFDKYEERISEYYILLIGQRLGEALQHTKFLKEEDLYSRIHLYLNYLRHSTKEFRKHCAPTVGGNELENYMAFFDDDDNRTNLLESLEYGIIAGFKPLPQLEFHCHREHYRRRQQAMLVDVNRGVIKEVSEMHSNAFGALKECSCPQPANEFAKH